MNYEAPRKFSSPPTAQELERLAEDVAALYRALGFGAPPAFRVPLGVATRDMVLAFGEARRCDTSGGQTIRALLPAAMRSGSGGALAVLTRTSSSGAIRVVPTFDARVDGASYYDVPSEVGSYAFLFDGRNWTSMRGQGLPGDYIEGDTIIIVNGEPSWEPTSPGRLSVESDTVALFPFTGALTDIGPSSFAISNTFGATRYGDTLPHYRGLFMRGTSVTDRFQSTATNSALAITGAATVEFVAKSAGAVYGNSSNLIVYHGTDSTGGGTANNKAWAVEFWRSAGGTGGIRWHQQHGNLGQLTEHIVDTEVPPVGELFHFAATRTPGQVVQFYINGVARGAASAALTTPVVGASGRLMIGGAGHDSVSLLDLRISNTARTADQIKSAYNTTLGPVYGRLA